MEAILLDSTTNAKTFNANLKRIFKDELKIPVRVRIINSYKFPRCYVEVWTDKDKELKPFPNALRIEAVKRVYPNTTEFSDNVSTGNIRPYSITLYAREWEDVFQKFLPIWSDGVKVN